MPVIISKGEAGKLLPGKKKNKKPKYKNTKVKHDGIVFDSKNEYNRYCFLLKMQKAGKICNLSYHQKKDEIILQEYPEIKYVPDFCYNEDDFFIIEDFKGYQTREFKLKKKLLIGLFTNKEKHTMINNVKFRLVSRDSGTFRTIEEYVFLKDKT